MTATVLALFLGCAAVAADLRSGHIPNRLTAGGAAAAFLFHVATAGARGAATSLAGAAVALALFLLPYLRGGLGGGDLKLMAAFGALLGPRGAFAAALLAALAGALFAAVSIWRRPGRAAIPYAPAIVAGAWLALLGRS